MKLPRRTDYYKAKKKHSDQALTARMEQIYLDFPRYEYRRVTKQLQREGWIVNHKKVARIMREKGCSCRPSKRKWIRTTDSNHNFSVYPNLIQDRSVDGINQVWVADITYIHLLVCFVYLAVILDVYSRKAIGYALLRHLDTQLTLSALRMAIDQRNLAPVCIHHSDRGVQYASKDYIKELEFYQFQISMSRKGNPYDNAFAESFIRTLKSEEVHLWEYRTMEDAQRRIPYFIEDVTTISGFIPRLAIALQVNLNFYWSQPLTPLRTLLSACSNLCSFKGSLQLFSSVTNCIFNRRT
jgi:putative transposase